MSNQAGILGTIAAAVHPLNEFGRGADMFNAGLATVPDRGELEPADQELIREYGPDMVAMLEERAAEFGKMAETLHRAASMVWAMMPPDAVKTVENKKGPQKSI